MAKQEQFETETKDWRFLFPWDILEQAKKLQQIDPVLSFRADDRHAKAIVETRRNRQFQVDLIAPAAYDEDWDDQLFSCTCTVKRSGYVKRGGGWRHSEICVHEALALLHWEQEHGPWVFSEPPELREKRLREQEAKEEEKRRKEEARRLAEEAKAREKRLRKRPLPAQDFFQGEDRPELFFQLKNVLSLYTTNEFCAQRARELLDAQAASIRTPTMGFGEAGSPLLSVLGSVKDKSGERSVSIELLRDRLERHRCSCNYSYAYYEMSAPTLCEHELAVLSLLREHIDRFDPGDATDFAANLFFRAMSDMTEGQELQSESESAPRPRTIRLSPRVLVEEGEMVLSYKIGPEGGKQVLLRSYRDFLNAVEERLVLPLSKTVTLDFSREDLTESSLPWLTFLQRRISETDMVNDRLNRSYYDTPTLRVKTRDTLAGAMLDRFYEQAEGTAVEYQNKDRASSGQLQVGHAPFRVQLRAQPIRSTNGPILGLEVRGVMPLILKGSAGSYMLLEHALSRITREEEAALQPFLAAADNSGQICFHVGREKLAEFYYRVVPRFQETPFVDFEDPCAEELQSLLPPEPHFRFRLDHDQVYEILTCETLVSYGEEAPQALSSGQSGPAYRDSVQEQRVQRVVNRFFPRQLSASGVNWVPYSEDTLYQILRDALPELARFGTVEGTSAFDRSTLRPMPKLQIGVSVESGLLEIELLSKDISPRELLAVLESYRQKKKYHRLHSGEYVELEDEGQLRELESLSRGMDFSLEQTIEGSVKLPMYRALYLDALLEERKGLYADRARTYRSLVKNFKTIRDADYEAPAAQAEILRPYQLYGYKWLRTLAAAGFGGILADEMGLGKTLQFIALAQALLDAGELSLSLVVCPASLVYNWQEEFKRFAPAMAVQVITGPAAQRKKMLSELQTGTVCITSYDLLRSDIAAYRALSFSLMVLDEAQYIKNQNAALTKAVKGVRSRLRFALTGTPIENRLAELWSIFDYLMPGFLYGYKEFSQRFETPITKQKDPEAALQLQRLTSPFILRRLKGDVLKDLPPKLEEVRYTRFDEQQRKVYDGQVVRMKQLVASVGSRGEDKIRILAELTRIRQICCDPSLLLEDYHGGSAKRSACLDLIRSAIGGGHRMLVFSQFTSMLALLEEDLRNASIPYFKLTGSTPKEERLRLVRSFNEGDTPVFLISLKAGGTGLNLTGADVVIHYDPWWNLAAQNQATDRAHRIGQQNQVTVYRIIVKDTIEERILALQEAKRDLAEAVLSGESQSLSSLSPEELLALLDTDI